WWRLTCQRLLIERRDRSVEKLLVRMAHGGKTAPGRAHALWTLHGLGVLTSELIGLALGDPSPGVRAQSLRLAEVRFAASVALRDTAVKLATDPSPQLRFQLAFSLG